MSEQAVTNEADPARVKSTVASVHRALGLLTTLAEHDPESLGQIVLSEGDDHEEEHPDPSEEPKDHCHTAQRAL